MVADAECRTVEAELCSPVSPAPGCELVLRQDFNRSGLFCLNVSLANGNGLAMATTRVAVGGATRGQGLGGVPEGRLGGAGMFLSGGGDRDRGTGSPGVPWVGLGCF